MHGPAPLTLGRLAREHGQAGVRVNDRAPARHADALPGGGGAQRTLTLTLAEYLRAHLLPLPETLAELAARPPAATPLYLNGWRAFADAPALAALCPPPYWAAAVDNTQLLLQALDTTLFGGGGKGGGGAPTGAAAAGGGAPAGAAASSGGDTAAAWWEGMDANLTKLFIGSPGALTRLHFDAGAAHGWLAQVAGRKLFVLLPPSQTPLLHQLPEERETGQSAVDPLRPDLSRHPLYAGAAPLACVLEPGGREKGAEGGRGRAARRWASVAGGGGEPAVRYRGRGAPVHDDSSTTTNTTSQPPCPGCP